MSIIGKSIEDQLLLHTIYEFFNAQLKEIEKDNPDTSKVVGVLQANPLFSLLVNIYLNEFDQFLISLKKKHDKNETSNKNTKNWNEETKVMINQLIRFKTRKTKNNLKREIHGKKIGIRQKPATDEEQSQHLYHKIYYVRHTDNYLIAIKGPKRLAKVIKKKTESFLKSNLHYKLKDGKLIHGRDNKASFLGFDIKIPSKKNRTVVETKKILSFKKIKNQISARKRTLETRFETAILKVYESLALRTIKAEMKEGKGKRFTHKTAKTISTKNAKEIMKNIKLNANKLYNDQKPFDT